MRNGQKLKYAVAAIMAVNLSAGLIFAQEPTGKSKGFEDAKPKPKPAPSEYAKYAKLVNDLRSNMGYAKSKDPKNDDKITFSVQKFRLNASGKDVIIDHSKGLTEEQQFLCANEILTEMSSFIRGSGDGVLQIKGIQIVVKDNSNGANKGNVPTDYDLSKFSKDHILRFPLVITRNASGATVCSIDPSLRKAVNDEIKKKTGVFEDKKEETVTPPIKGE